MLLKACGSREVGLTEWRASFGCSTVSNHDLYQRANASNRSVLNLQPDPQVAQRYEPAKADAQGNLLKNAKAIQRAKVFIHFMHTVCLFLESPDHDPQILIDRRPGTHDPRYNMTEAMLDAMVHKPMICTYDGEANHTRFDCPALSIVAKQQISTMLTQQEAIERMNRKIESFGNPSGNNRKEGSRQWIGGKHQKRERSGDRKDRYRDDDRDRKRTRSRDRGRSPGYGKRRSRSKDGKQDDHQKPRVKQEDEKRGNKQKDFHRAGGKDAPSNAPSARV